MSSIAVRRLENPSDAEVKRVVEVLQAAFGEGDPFTDFLVGGDRTLVPAKFESSVRAASMGGEIHVASLGPTINDIVGTAVWYGPGQISMSTEEQREMASKVFYSKCPEELKSWWHEHFLPSMMRLANESLGPGFKETQWALQLLGVVPEHHRKGIAKAMVKTVEKRAKADNVSIVLETTTALDLLIYKHMGFEVKGQVTITSPLGQSPMYQLMKIPTSFQLYHLIQKWARIPSRRPESVHTPQSRCKWSFNLEGESSRSRQQGFKIHFCCGQLPRFSTVKLPPPAPVARSICVCLYPLCLIISDPEAHIQVKQAARASSKLKAIVLKQQNDVIQLVLRRRIELGRIWSDAKAIALDLTEFIGAAHSGAVSAIRACFEGVEDGGLGLQRNQRWELGIPIYTLLVATAVKMMFLISTSKLQLHAVTNRDAH
ncbi:hypothetical protein D9615_003711 [Tricholomella constricta]|uniref:N-acetyltransferase domain-containing protein n=1 Tax=Tricholomella constricta TaxID=117010 RepID=A0A8H5M7J8_9AGAR|nr:hypothetical protein D9615_003711 [Tricholomella constricta]